MKTLGLGIGVAIGFLAGNAEARQKTLNAFKSIESSPQAQAVENRVSAKVTQLSSRMTGAPQADDSDLYSLGSDADDGATLTLSDSQPSR